eukprot:246394_1
MSKSQLKKVPPPALARSGTNSFKLTLEQLYDIPVAKYLQDDVIIKYWHIYPDVFEGQISCISSKMQIRLQHINCLYIDKELLPRPWHHSYWFHYKNIKSIYFENQEITNDILDIMKYRMIQSFLFYYAENEIYQSSTKYIKYLQTDNVNRIVTQLSQNPSNHELYLKCKIPKILDMALHNPSRFQIGQYRSSSFESAIEDFLYDMNRINSHLLLKRDFKNKQRIASCFTVNELLRILDHYKELVVQYVKTLYGINNLNVKRYEKHIKNNFFADQKQQDATPR